MRPALQFITRHLASSINSCLFNGTVSNSLSKVGPTNLSNGGTITDMSNDNAAHGHVRKDSQGAFYRLPDESKYRSPDSSKTPVDATLRPDHGCVYTVASVPGTSETMDSLSGDEIPLHSIYVHKEVTQVTT